MKPYTGEDDEEMDFDEHTADLLAYTITEDLVEHFDATDPSTIPRGPHTKARRQHGVLQRQTTDKCDATKPIRPRDDKRQDHQTRATQYRDLRDTFFFLTRQW